jgi:hypothetical protein
MSGDPESPPSTNALLASGEIVAWPVHEFTSVDIATCARTNVQKSDREAIPTIGTPELKVCKRKANWVFDTNETNTLGPVGSPRCAAPSACSRAEF